MKPLWIVPWDGEDPCAVCHDDVLALAGHAETSFPERSHGIKMVHAGELRHGSSDLDLANIRAEQEFVANE